MSKPILCLDFDGVCHSYTSGWQGARIIPDPPVPGLFGFLAGAVKEFEVHIYSTRSAQEGGIQAMKDWFDLNLQQWRNSEEGVEHPVIELQFPASKPMAKVTIDDRAVTFTGTFPEVEWLKAFQPWTRSAETNRERSIT